MRWYAGTSGYSYKEWKGAFYPDDLPADRMLGYYAERLPTVEINNTFYRMPRRAVLETWAGAVPDGFRFVIKASRRITHLKRLKDAAEPTRYLMDNLAALEHKLGAVLFQLPPNLRADRERLAAFLELLPDRVPAAFEFRHESWHDPSIVDLLRDAGAALCVAEGESGSMTELEATAPFLYLRLRKADYGDGELTDWRDRGVATGAETAFVFFKHEDDAAGPAMAERFLMLTEAPATTERRGPAAAGARQPRGRRAAQRSGSGTTASRRNSRRA